MPKSVVICAHNNRNQARVPVLLSFSLSYPTSLLANLYVRTEAESADTRRRISDTVSKKSREGRERWSVVSKCGIREHTDKRIMQQCVDDGGGWVVLIRLESLS